ncbi:MAG: thermonuclease family protein [Alphaproteobacteria bacterium]|nr:thermonuclease family protein [Alphaproteobacteria bacterium]MBN2780130.1 thermonuclease family protein [Alphaproteobacteria bacterium]
MHYLFPVFLFFFALTAESATFKGVKKATVLRVVDGDTFDARITLEKNYTVDIKVRILGIDTPERSGLCQKEIEMAEEAKQLLEKYLTTTVTLKNMKDGKYHGRVLANVILKNGQALTPILLKSPLVRPYQGKKRKPWCESTNF